MSSAARFTVPVRRGPALGPEHSRWYFHPGRVDARLAPDHFRAKLHEIAAELEACWHPIMERWQVWARNPRRTSGWQLVFPVQTPEGAFLPLDERTLAKAWDRSARRWGNGRLYWDRIVSEFHRDKARAEQAADADRDDVAKGWYDHSKIQVGYGRSRGDKFAEYHA